ncbi:hypothetical protein FOLKNPGA_03284 [Legionella sp. PC1000]|uniref:hypothetical protein n=1 Tax=Legionella sp. PC1000 TaxID=2746060 RepID=UPI0015FAD288|nr:hypothetical protein [Legionella sp. PC1000]QLZ70470.1 hypothetical protein FOLKNPGA_03284 [Legionella sp. PC1000]
MKLIINKKNSMESITLDLDATTGVRELLFILYSYRGKFYERFSFNEYQKFISIYECLLYGDRFKNKLLPGTHLADYQLVDPCYLTWEEFTESHCPLTHLSSERIDSRVYFWQANITPGEPKIENESLLLHTIENTPGTP